MPTEEMPKREPVALVHAGPGDGHLQGGLLFAGSGGPRGCGKGARHLAGPFGPTISEEQDCALMMLLARLCKVR